MSTTARKPSRSPWAWLYWWPIRRADQAVFAEAFGQCLAAGMEVSTAVFTAASALRSRSFRAAVREMAANCRHGHTLADSLRRTGAGVGYELLAALDVGEDRGELPGSLSAFARRHDPRAGGRVAAAVGRPVEVTRFAAALGRLLADRRLTVGLIEDAAALAAGDGSQFATVVERVAVAMRNGQGFAEALSPERATFDPLFRALVGATSERTKLRSVLIRLGEASD